MSNNSNNTAQTSPSISVKPTVLPFQPENIKNITPIVKFIEIVSDDARANIEMVKY